MANIKPFQAIRPTAQTVNQIASVPYDVVDRDEAAHLATGNPLSFLHVSRAEIDLDSSINPYSDEVYTTANKNYQKLLTDGSLTKETAACLYVYRLKMGDQVQTGLAAAYSVDEYDTDKIKKHEKTRKEKEDDRTRHICELKAQTGPVFLTYRGRPEIDTLVEQVTKSAPLYDLVSADDVHHTIWRVEETSALVTAFQSVNFLYIADGHHRAASASRARAQLRQSSQNWTGSEDANFFLAVSFPADQLKILPYNRVIKDLNGRTAETLLAELKAQFTVTETAAAFPSAAGKTCFYLGGVWRELTLAPGQGDSPSARLDAALLQDQILSEKLGIQDPRTDKRIDFVGGIRGTKELETLVDSGKGAIAFSMVPTSVNDLMAISDADEIMPPKSTWFEPKLRDALLIHSI
jgi:uncharacterized protein (DUF1015 family)